MTLASVPNSKEIAFSGGVN